MPDEVQVTTTPLDLGDALGLDATDPNSFLAILKVSAWRVQNRGAATVYRTAAATAPDPAAVRGFRHGTGSVLKIRIFTEVPTWLWTGAGSATLIFERLP